MGFFSTNGNYVLHVNETMPHTLAILSGLTVTILAAYKTIFHLQRIGIVKESAPIARFFAVVCTCVTHRVQATAATTAA